MTSEQSWGESLGGCSPKSYCWQHPVPWVERKGRVKLVKQDGRDPFCSLASEFHFGALPEDPKTLRIRNKFLPYKGRHKDGAKGCR